MNFIRSHTYGLTLRVALVVLPYVVMKIRSSDSGVVSEVSWSLRMFWESVALAVMACSLVHWFWVHLLMRLSMLADTFIMGYSTERELVVSKGVPFISQIEVVTYQLALFILWHCEIDGQLRQQVSLDGLE